MVPIDGHGTVDEVFKQLGISLGHGDKKWSKQVSFGA